MGKIYQLVVYVPTGEKMFVDLCNSEEQMKSMTVLQLKEKIVRKLPEYAGTSFSLIFIDKLLGGDTTLLSSYGVQHMSVIQLVSKASGGGF